MPAKQCSFMQDRYNNLVVNNVFNDNRIRTSLPMSVSLTLMRAGANNKNPCHVEDGDGDNRHWQMLWTDLLAAHAGGGCRSGQWGAPHPELASLGLPNSHNLAPSPL